MSLINRPTQAPVYELQIMLKTVLSDRNLNPDGIYGTETQAAVREFQQNNGLPVTGEVDGATWEALSIAYQRKHVLQRQAEPLQIVLQPYQIIKKNEENLHLFVVQGIFLALKALILDAPLVTATGVLDAQTQAAILWLQRRSDLEETGELDKATWRQLSKQYRATIGDGTGSFPIRRTQQPVNTPQRTTANVTSR